jgi:hypothetical protein
MQAPGGMELRCKVFRAARAADLEEAINCFLEEVTAGEVQFEEITQSEGPDGVTVVLWYSVTDSELDDLEEGPDELEEGANVPRELA